MHTLMKNTMVIPFVTITFFLFGWWIYFALPNGPFIFEGKGLVEATANAVPWSELMGTHLGGPPLTDTDDRRRQRALGAAQRRVLGGVPAVLLDGRLDRLRCPDRARALGRLLADRRAGRLGDLDRRRRLGLALRRLDGQDAGLPRRLRVGRGPRHRGRRRARRADPARAAHRQVPRRRHAAQHRPAEPLAGDDRPVPDLRRLLGLLRRLQRTRSSRPTRSACRASRSPPPRST